MSKPFLRSLKLSRKALAQQAGVNYAIIGAGLQRDSVPAANTALRLAKALHIPLENLLDDDFSDCEQEAGGAAISEAVKKNATVLKYWAVYEDLELLPASTRQIVIEMVHKLAYDAKRSV